MGKFDRFAFSAHAAFDEPAVRQAFAQAVPLKTVVIYCYDPRAAQIPCAVAKRFGETFPGELVVNEHGLKIASTTTLFPVVVAGGRAFDAFVLLRSRSTYSGSRMSSSSITRIAVRRRSLPAGSSVLFGTSSMPISLTRFRPKRCALPTTSNRSAAT